MKRNFVITAVAVVFGMVSSAATHTITLTRDMTLAEALGTISLTESSLNGGANKADDVVFKVANSSVPYKVTFSKALPNWTGNLTAEAGVIIYGVSDSSSYATVLGAAATSETAVNGVVKIKDGATLQLRTNSGNNEYALSRPVYITGIGVEGKGALRLSTTNNIRAMYPKYIHLDGDARLTRLENDGFLNGGTVWTTARYLYLHNHVLTISKSDANLQIIWENPHVFTGGTSAGIIATDGCIFTFRDMSNFDGDSNNFMQAKDPARLTTQYGFGPSSGWRLLYDTPSAFDPGNYQSYTTYDDVAKYRCWRGPAVLNKDFTFTDNTDWVYQLGFQGKVTGAGAIYAAAKSGHTGEKMFHLYSGENDFQGGLSVLGFTLRMGAPTSVPSGANAGPLYLHNADVDFNYDYRVGDFTLPDTTFDGVGKFYSKVHADVMYKHRGSFKSLTKTGDGTLDIDAQLTGGDLVVNGGMVKLHNPVGQMSLRNNLSGLWYGYAEGNNTQGDLASYVDITKYNGAVYTNSTVQTPYDFDYKGNETTIYWLWRTRERGYRTYSGYIWNDTDKVQTWSFLVTLNIKYYIKVGDVEQSFLSPINFRPNNVLDFSKANAKFYQFNLKPGANYFEFRCAVQYAGVGESYYDNGALTGPFLWNNINGNTNGLDKIGVFYDAQSHETAATAMHNIDYYTAFTPDNAAKVFTRYNSLEQYYESEGIDPDRMAYSKLNSIAGSGMIDLDGGILKVDAVNFAGGLTVTNGTLQLMSIITNDTAALDMSAMSGTVKFDVVQDASHRRAAVPGMWYGLVIPVNDSTYTKPHATASYFANALADTKADFYMTFPETEVVTEMAPMTHITEWPPEGTEYANLWQSTASESFWANDSNRYKTWKGYVWNSSATNEYWTIVSCNNAYIDMYLNGWQCYKNDCSDNRQWGDYSGQNGWSRNTFMRMTGKFGSAAVIKNVMVAPGPNELKVRYYSRWNVCSFWPGSTETNYNRQAFVKWSEGHGMVFDRKGRGTTNLDNYEDFKDATSELITREIPDEFPFLKGEGATADLNGRETATGMLIGHVRAVNGLLVVDGVWNVNEAQIKGGVASNGLKFNEYSKLIISGISIEEIVATMPSSGYLLATNSDGVPRLIGAEGTPLKIVNRGGDVYLISGRSGFYIHYK